jgi:hypothetical protein
MVVMVVEMRVVEDLVLMVEMLLLEMDLVVEVVVDILMEVLRL